MTTYFWYDDLYFWWYGDPDGRLGRHGPFASYDEALYRCDRADKDHLERIMDATIRTPKIRASDMFFRPGISEND